MLTGPVRRRYDVDPHPVLSPHTHGSPFPSPPPYLFISSTHHSHSLKPLSSYLPSSIPAFIHPFLCRIHSCHPSVVVNEPSRSTFCATSRWKQTNGMPFFSLSSTDLLKILPLPLINPRPASCDLPSQGRCPRCKYLHPQYVTRYYGFTVPPPRHPRLQSTGRQRKIGSKR